ncbi:MAG TPA: SDR family oxidoreductase [Rugosibacter sp.]|nr:SDR family oxidoreductase [Rugosibacter sp.]MDD3379701.1 SDR family oxidoreductase [Rugosibacter sp.]HPB91448.1 SDR family oxidoreductase [Rugosibacter sp.]HQN46201.1 SDR family oxidoreductase [Rugosibacter sp.]HQQ35331.1 SDR family oxidoreductase [Rugosibacter sp.]
MIDKNKPRELAVMVGATGSLGKVIANRLVVSGLDLLAVGRSEAALESLTAGSPHMRYCVADISDNASIQTIAQSIDAPVRIAIHAPGVPVAGGVLEAPPDVLAQAVNIKAGGMMRLFRAVEKHLVKHSRLVAVGGHYGFEPTAYAATAGVANAALTNLMRQLSWAVGERGITAHLVAPGPAETERLHAIAAASAAKRGVTAETVLNELLEESAIHAFTSPEQVAWGICLLLAPEADAMAGASIMLDAGRRRGLP